MAPTAHLLFHAGNVLYLTAFIVRDILWLRVLIVVSQSALMPFYYFCSDDGHPMLPPLMWGSLTILINLVQIVLLLLQRNPVFLGEAELKLYKTKFHTLKVREFMKLMSIADWQRAHEPNQLIAQGDVIDRLWLMTAGTAEVHVDGRRVSAVGGGEFAGEMGFLTHEPASASVTAAPGAEYCMWLAKDLRGLFASRPDLEAKFRSVLGGDLVQKLRRLSEAAAHPSRMMDARPPID